jgi:hypothetical protein
MSTVRKHASFRTMSIAQKQAAFNLATILLSLITVLALTPILGFHAAQGGFGVLGLIGLSPFLFRKRAGQVFMDERDVQIQLRSSAVAYFVFWMVFVAICVSAPFTYGSSGVVRVELIQSSVWYGFMLVWGISAIATLVQYRGGVAHEAE